MNNKTAVVIFADGFETMEALIPVDILRRLNVSTIIAGLDKLEIVSAQGVKIYADAVLNATMNLPDVIVIPGGMPGAENIGSSVVAENFVRAQNERNGLIAAICAAPVKALARWNLLSNKRATCFSSCVADFPTSVKHVDEAVVVDGNIITSQGAGTTFAFAYKIGEILFDAPTINDLQKRMMYK